jgi:hypothetical protein
MTAEETHQKLYFVGRKEVLTFVIQDAVDKGI